MAELKPCPFCGKEPIIIQYSPTAEFWGKVFIVVCENKYCYCKPKTEYCSTKETAVELWNRRADNG